MHLKNVTQVRLAFKSYLLKGLSFFNANFDMRRRNLPVSINKAIVEIFYNHAVRKVWTGL